jgi:hypothetical protein
MEAIVPSEITVSFIIVLVIVFELIALSGVAFLSLCSFKAFTPAAGTVLKS